MSDKLSINMSLLMLSGSFNYFNGIILDSSRIAQNQESGEISWQRYQPGIHRGTNYVEEHRWLLDAGQYSVLFTDQSFLQFYYSFEENDLRKARLAYYPSPYDYNNSDFTEDEIDELVSSGIGYKEIFEGAELKHATHLRIDYDHRVTSHAKTHLQFSAINSLRIDLEYCLLPAAFFDYIVSNFFPAVHSQAIAENRYRNAVSHARNHKIQQRDHSRHLYLTCE